MQQQHRCERRTPPRQQHHQHRRQQHRQPRQQLLLFACQPDEHDHDFFRRRHIHRRDEILRGGRNEPVPGYQAHCPNPNIKCAVLCPYSLWSKQPDGNKNPWRLKCWSCGYRFRPTTVQLWTAEEKARAVVQAAVEGAADEAAFEAEIAEASDNTDTEEEEEAERELQIVDEEELHLVRACTRCHHPFPPAQQLKIATATTVWECRNCGRKSKQHDSIPEPTQLQDEAEGSGSQASNNSNNANEESTRIREYYPMDYVNETVDLLMPRGWLHKDSELKEL